MTTTESSERKLLPREDRRASILRAAASAFARGGFADTSMSAVATEAGVTRVLLYRHFDTKEDLYRAVLDQVVTELAAEWTARTHQGGDALRAHLRAARANPDGYRLLWHQAEGEPMFTEYARGVRSMIEQIADERVTHQVAPELRPWAMATLISAIVESVLAWLDHGHPGQDDAFLTTATAGLRHMVDAWAE